MLRFPLSCTISIVALCYFLVGTTTMVAEERPTLRIMNWSDYLGEQDEADDATPLAQRMAVLRSFMEQHNCLIDYQEYDDPMEINDRLAQFPGHYDLIIGDYPTVARLAAAGQLQPIPGTQVALRDQVSDHLFVSGGVDRQFYIPLFAGVTGLAYRSDLVSAAPQSWKDFFDADDAHAGKLGLLGDGMALFGATLIYQGVGLAEADTAAIRDAGRLLAGHLRSGHMVADPDPATIGGMLASGDLHMAVMWSPDALFAAEEAEDVPIRFVIPSEGAEQFVDSLMILSDAPQAELALAFVNHLLDPAVHAEVATYNFSHPSTPAALAAMVEADPALADIESVTLPTEIRGRLQLWPGVVDAVDQLWERMRDLVAE